MSDSLPLDMLGRELHNNDYVVYYTNIYRVVEVYRNSYVKIMLISPSKTTKPVKKFSKEMCLIPSEDIVAWALRSGFKLHSD